MNAPDATFTVTEARPDDVGRGLVRLDPADLKALGARLGDILEIRGTRTTVGRAMPQHAELRGQRKVQIDGVTRGNAGVSVGDALKLRRIEAPAAGRLVVVPEGVALGRKDVPQVARLVDGLACITGDRLRVSLFGGRRVTLVVTDSLPRGPVRVGPSTELVLEKPKGATKSGDAPKAAGPTWEDIGGLGHQLRRIREIVELPLRRPDLFARLGIDPPRGVLLHGPPGTGKTLIARTIAHEADAAFFPIRGPEVIQKHYGESEKRLRQVFETAAKKGPSVVFIDEIDSLAPKRTSVQGEVEKRVVATLLNLLDGLDGRDRVVVLAATNLPDNLDPALRRPGRFDREIEVPIPDRPGRRQILAIHTRGMPLTDDVDLDALAAVTHGFVGADLQALCREAAMACLREVLEAGGGVDGSVDAGALTVRHAHFTGALTEVSPSALREVFVEVPDVHWDDIGGLDAVKQQLVETVEWPMHHAEVFQAARVRPPKGILLHGPPGTGKTLLAKAVATETGANFLSVKGPELYSRYVGDAEASLREVFRKARLAAPCVVFFDEVDGLLPSREAASDNAVAERLLAQFLAEMDGVEALNGVLVLAATNRLDRMDPAALRPGRFDALVEIGLPDASARAAILGVHLRDRPVADDVDIEALAARADAFSGAEVAAVADLAALDAVRRVVDGSDAAPRITGADLASAMARIALREGT